MLLGGCAANGGGALRPSQQQPLARLSVPSEGADTQAMTQLMLAEFALDDGDMPTASRAYARAAALSPDARVAEASAGLAVSQGQTDQAEAAIDRMHETGADAQALARERARLALMRGHRDEARSQLEKVLAPDNREAWQAFARLLSDARDPALAGTLLENMANADTLPGDRPELWVAMSQLGEKLNRHVFAEKLAEQAAERFQTAQTLAWAGHLKMVAGREQDGLGLYARALDKDPDNDRLRLMYAAALGKAGRNRDALDVLRKGPEDLDVLAGRAAYAARLQDRKEMARVYATLKRNRARFDQDASFLIGQLAESLGRNAAAIEAYAAVPLTDRHAFEAGIRRAVLLDATGKPGQAHALTRQLQRDYADDQDSLRRTYLLDAQLYVRDEHPAEAIDAYSRGLEALPEDTELLYGRALSHADLGQTSAAIADLRHVLELKPDDIDAMNALGYTLADENRDLDEAGTLLRRALDSKPDEPAIIDSWGWLQYRLGDLKSAEASLRKAWSMRKDPDIGVHLGEVLWQSGRHEAARKVFDQVRRDDPHNAALHETEERLER